MQYYKNVVQLYTVVENAFIYAFNYTCDYIYNSKF